MGCGTSAEAADACTGFCIPKLHLSVERASHEARTIVIEADIRDRLCVTRVGTQQLALVVNIPNLDFAVRRSREQQVSSIGEEAQLGDSLGMRLPGMQQLLGRVVLVVVWQVAS